MHDVAIIEGGTASAPLVAVIIPPSSPLAQQEAVRLAGAERRRQGAVYLAVCEHADTAGAPRQDWLRARYAAFDVVLAVAASRSRQLVDRLLRTIAAPDAPGQWLACDWGDMRHVLGTCPIVRYGSGRATGGAGAAAAAAAAVREIDAAGPGWRAASGVCIGIRSSSQETGVGAVRDVLEQVCAGIDAGVTITLAGWHEGGSEDGALEVHIFAIGERQAAQAAEIDAAARAWSGADGAPDPLYPHARSLVLQHRRASVSMVQRHLRIGYGRASRLIDAMQGDILSATGDDGLPVLLDRHPD